MSTRPDPRPARPTTAAVFTTLALVLLTAATACGGDGSGSRRIRP